MGLFDRLAEAELYSDSFALVTILSVNGITPRTEGRMAVFRDGSSIGTIGGGEMERKAVDEALKAIKDGKSKKITLPVRKEGSAEIYIDVPIKDRRVVLIGAGHLSRAVAILFHFLSWNVTVIDRRPDCVNDELFPYARCIVSDNIASSLSSIGVDGNTAIIITNPADGEEIFSLLDGSPVFYVGMVGSRQRDFSAYKFLHAPMGLDLGGETPEEVALSIVSEVIASFNKRDAKALSSFKNNLVIVRGAGDLATGTILRLYSAGYKVIALESKNPTVIRRTVSFASAVYDGEIEIEGVRGVLAEDISSALLLLDQGFVPILVDEDATSISELKPAIVVDAILAKKNLGTHREMAKLVIGLGPGFEAGNDVDLVIETKRGHTLGQIIRKGSAVPNTGIPGIIDGYGKERVIHSPATGVFKGSCNIGDIVKKNEVIGYVGKVEVKATIDGCLRGLLHDGLTVPEGFKIADIDPRGEGVDWRGVSDKARAIAGGVLEAICHYTKFGNI